MSFISNVRGHPKSSYATSRLTGETMASEYCLFLKAKVQFLNFRYTKGRNTGKHSHQYPGLKKSFYHDTPYFGIQGEVDSVAGLLRLRSCLPLGLIIARNLK